MFLHVVTLLVVPVWFLVIALAACGAMLWGRPSASKNAMDHLAVQKPVCPLSLDAYAEEAKEAETLRQAHKATIYALHIQLTKLEYVVRGTDNASEKECRDICKEHGEAYEMPDPLEGAAEFALEIAFLHKVLSAIHYDLYEKRISDPDMQFYQNWVTSLQSHITFWNERRQALLRLKNLLGRLHVLEKMLHFEHGVETYSSSYTAYPVQSHQNLFDLVVAFRKFLEMKRTSKNADLVKEVAQFTLEVQALERQHEALDGALTVAYEETHQRIKQTVLGAWDSVMAYAFESSPCVLMAYSQESQTKYEDEYVQALQILGNEGECAQHKAVEHLSTSMKHWGFWRALNVVMSEVCDAKFVAGAYGQFLLDVEVKIPHCLQELKQVMENPFAFDDEFISFHPLFS